MKLSRHALIAFAGSLLLVATAIWLPHEWYDTLPRRYKLPSLPIRGTTLFEIMLCVQAAALFVVGLAGWRWQSLPASAHIDEFQTRETSDDISQRAAMWWLSAITALALALRLFRVGSDLWIDEILTVEQFASESFAYIIGSYRTSNNHMLMSVLIKISMMIFGEHEWSIRLPAVLVGVASVPAVYRIARYAMSRRASLGAALLLAVSYHHIFFSQNARGYGAYVFFAMVSSRALLDALHRDRRRDWIVFGVATVLGFVSLLNTMFVVGAQLLVAAVVVFRLHQRGGAVAPLVQRLLTVFAITGFISVQLYAFALPEAFVVITDAYTQASTGFSAGSSDLTRDIVRGITDGFGSRAVFAAVPFLLIAAGGLVVLWRRQWAVATLLLMPGVLTAAMLLARGLTFSPRFFLLWLALAVVTAAATIDALTTALRAVQPERRHVLASAVTVVLAAVSMWSLQRYYTVPKQPYSATLKYIEQHRRPDDLFLAIKPSITGVRYYGRRLKVPLDSNYREVGNDSDFVRELAARGSRRVFLITTLERGSGFQRPTLTAHVRRDFRRDTTFPATVGNGELSIWSEQRAHPFPRD